MPPDEKVVNWTKLSSSFISLWPIVPILILPLAEAEDVIEVIVVNLVEPTAVLEDETPGICSSIAVPLELVPVTVNILPVSLAEQYIVTTAFKLFAFFNEPSGVIVPALPGLAEAYKLSSSLTYNL